MKIVTFLCYKIYFIPYEAKFTTYIHTLYYNLKMAINSSPKAQMK